MSDMQTLPTPMRHAARAALVLGLFMCVRFAMYMYMLTMPVLALGYLLMTLAVPFVAYRLTRSYRDMLPSQIGFPVPIAWSHGTLLFFFASILLLLPYYYYYSVALPEQIPVFEAQMAHLYAQAPELRAAVEQAFGGSPVALLRTLLAQNSIGSLLWSGLGTTLFFGSIVSLINAFILRRRPVA